MGAGLDALSDIDASLKAAPPTASAPIPPPQATPGTSALGDINDALSGKLTPQPTGWTMAAPGQPSPQQTPGFWGWLGNGAKTMGQGFLDALTAGAQGTSPIVPKNYTLAPQDEQDKFAELGVPSDQTKYVALRDPGTGKYAVYNRNPQMNEGAATGLGRVFQYALPGEGIPSVATSSALSPSQNLLKDFTASGVTPSIPTVGQGIGSRLTTNIVSKVPIIGGPVASAVNTAAGDTGQAAERLASGMGPAINAEDAGTAVQKGINQAATRFKNQAGQLYDEFRGTIDPNAPVDINNTLDALKGPLDRFPTSPALGSQITNPRLQQMFSTLAPQTKNVPAVYSSVLGPDGNPILLQAASKVQTGGKLSFGELGELRSTIGRMLGDPQLIDNIPRADLKNVYAGISTDLGNAAQKAGPDAYTAFNQANSFYKAGIDRMDQLDSLLSGSPEQTFAKINTAAGTGASANADLLRTLQQTLPSNQFNNIGAAVIRRMGMPTAGNMTNVHGADPFSVDSFVTNWNKLSPAAKDTLFGQGGAGSTRDGLESLVRVADAQKQVGKFANPSGTASHTLMGMAAEHVGGFLEHPFQATLGLLGGRLAGNALMSPTFARWLYGTGTPITNAVAGAQPSLARLGQMVRVDPRLAPAYQQLLAGQQGGGAQGSP